MSDRRRNALILLIVAGLIIVSLLFAVVGVPGAVKAKKTRLGLDLKGGVELVYEAKPTARSKVDTESLERAIDIMRKRVDQLGVAQPEIQRSGAAEILVAETNRRGGRDNVLSRSMAIAELLCGMGTEATKLRPSNAGPAGPVLTFAYL